MRTLAGSSLVIFSFEALIPDAIRDFEYLCYRQKRVVYETKSLNKFINTLKWPQQYEAAPCMTGILFLRNVYRLSP